MKIIIKSLAILSIAYIAGSIGFSYWTKYQLDWRFIDISDEPEYANHVGKTYVTTEPAYIVKLTQDVGPFHKDGLIYSVLAHEVAGSDLLMNETFPVGSRITVHSVVKCHSCSHNNTAVIIKVLSSSKYDDAPVYFELEELFSKNSWTRMISG